MNIAMKVVLSSIVFAIGIVMWAYGGTHIPTNVSDQVVGAYVWGHFIGTTTAIVEMLALGKIWTME